MKNMEIKKLNLLKTSFLPLLQACTARPAEVEITGLTDKNCDYCCVFMHNNDYQKFTEQAELQKHFQELLNYLWKQHKLQSSVSLQVKSWPINMK